VIDGEELSCWGKVFKITGTSATPRDLDDEIRFCNAGVQCLGHVNVGGHRMVHPEFVEICAYPRQDLSADLHGGSLMRTAWPARAKTCACYGPSDRRRGLRFAPCR